MPRHLISDAHEDQTVFHGVCSLESALLDISFLTFYQIMFNIDRAHMILDEMIMNGYIVETNRSRVLAPIAVLDKSSR